MTAALSDIDLDAALAAELPCEGLITSPSGDLLGCDNPAQWRRVFNHDCPRAPKNAFKCDFCYTLLSENWNRIFARTGKLVCFWCGFEAARLADYAKYIRL